MKIFANIFTGFIALVLGGVVGMGANSGKALQFAAQSEAAIEPAAVECIASEDLTEEAGIEEYISAEPEYSASAVIAKAAEELEPVSSNVSMMSDEDIEKVTEEAEKEAVTEAAEEEAGAEEKIAKVPTTGKAEAEETGSAKTAKTAQQRVIEEAQTRGSYGRMYIRSVGVDVAVFFTSNFDRLQRIVDAKDSACMFDWDDGNRYIADHSNQGFKKLKSVSVGTYAELVTPNGTYGYTCEEIIYDGWNTGSQATYHDHTPIGSRYFGKLVMYTCNSNGTITITIWG